MSRDDAQTPGGQIVVYEDADGGSRIRVLLQGETVWLTQRLLADLYQISVKTVNEHLVNIYAEGEIEKKATIRSYQIVQTEGKREVSRSIDHYNLDAILAVGYRVRSVRGVQFRQWATDSISRWKPLAPNRAANSVLKPFYPSLAVNIRCFSLDMRGKCRYPDASRPAMPLPNGTHTLAGFSLRRPGVQPGLEASR